jgi:hypothetical protein
MATVNYLVTKTHNYSSANKYYVKEWLKNVESFPKEYNVSKYDLFNWEHRFGRWMSNSIQNYDYLVNQTYIFNCRYLIELWINIPRSERTNRSFHEEVIKSEWPELLEVEFNPDEKLMNRIFNNSYAFYYGSIAKHYIKKIKKNKL